MDKITLPPILLNDGVVVQEKIYCHPFWNMVWRHWLFKFTETSFMTNSCYWNNEKRSLCYFHVGINITWVFRLRVSFDKSIAVQPFRNWSSWPREPIKHGTFHFCRANLKSIETVYVFYCRFHGPVRLQNKKNTAFEA